MNSIQNFTTAKVALPLPPAAPNAARDSAGVDFKQMLMDSISNVNTMQAQADRAVETLMTGGEVDPAAVLTALQKADLGFRMMLQMRNKVMAAYQEIKDIRV